MQHPRRQSRLMCAFLLNMLSCFPSAVGQGRNAARVIAAEIPLEFREAFILPTGDKDQYGNAVITRDNAKFCPKTKWPYEIWLRKPRLEFLLIPAGEFMMGSREGDKRGYRKEQPQHRVLISKPFYMGKYELTNAQYQHFESNRRRMAYREHSLSHDRQPVVYVSWTDVALFCEWMTAQSGIDVKLPTEAEWEYACRACTQTVYYWGDELDPACCNFADRSTEFSFREPTLADGHPVTAPVGMYRPNAFGLYDMLGNVSEWCRDRYQRDYYAKSPETDPEGPSSGFHRVLRGGSWCNSQSHVRCAYRTQFKPTSGHYSIGFRLVAHPGILH